MALTIALQPEIEARFQAEAAREGTSAEDWAARCLVEAEAFFRSPPILSEKENEMVLSDAEIAELAAWLTRMEVVSQELTMLMDGNLRLLSGNVRELEEARSLLTHSNTLARTQGNASQ